MNSLTCIEKLNNHSNMSSRNISPPPKFNFTPAEISAKTDFLVQQTTSAIKHITSSIKPQDATFGNVIVPIGFIENELSYDLEVIYLLESVSPSAAIRKAASEATKEAKKAFDAIYRNDELFVLIDVVKDSNPKNLDEESERLLGDLHHSCVSEGLKLTGTTRARFSEITNRKNELRSAFVSNLATDPGFISMHEYELEGVSQSTLESWQTDDQRRHRIPLNKPNFSAVMRQCTNEQTRKDVFIAKESIYHENATHFREAILLRDEAARMLGCTSYNHQLVRHRMMKTPEAVMNLLGTVGTKVKPLVGKEMEKLREMRGDGGPIHFWDFVHYDERMLKERDVNSELVAQYFPADFVIGRMLEIFEQLFHLEIIEVVDRDDGGVWHPDVKVYTVVDLVQDVFVGYLYMDLYPRDGKYNHAADFNVRPVSFIATLMSIIIEQVDQHVII